MYSTVGSPYLYFRQPLQSPGLHVTATDAGHTANILVNKHLLVGMPSPNFIRYEQEEKYTKPQHYFAIPVVP